MQAVIFGCGYLGSRLAHRWSVRGDEVTAVTRSPEKGKLFEREGGRRLLADVANPTTLKALPRADLVLYAVGYDRHAGPSRREVVVDGLANVLAALEGKVGRLVFISSTSVYGQSDGSWVDESTPPEPTTMAGELALEAEEIVRAAPCDTILLRSSGLYGPGRLLRRLEQLRNREPIAGSGEAWLNLVHVEDAAQGVELAAERLLRRPTGNPASETFLLSDDRPLRRREYYGMLAEAAEAPAPRFDPEAGGGRIVKSGKRCRNERARGALGWEPAAPRVTEEVLRACLR